MLSLRRCGNGLLVEPGRDGVDCKDCEACSVWRLTFLWKAGVMSIGLTLDK